MPLVITSLSYGRARTENWDNLHINAHVVLTMNYYLRSYSVFTTMQEESLIPTVAATGQ